MTGRKPRAGKRKGAENRVAERKLAGFRTADAAIGPSDGSGDEASEVPAAVPPVQDFEPDWKSAALPLSSAQRLALEQMISGRSFNEAAAAARINRTTLYRWLHDDANFQAAYNAWQSDAAAMARARLLTLTDSAIAAVQSALDRGDAKAGLTFLKSLGILAPPTPGPTDAKEIERERDLAETRRTAREMQENFDASIGLETIPTRKR